MTHAADTNLSPVAALRRALGMTLVEMGLACGISKSQMHEVERTGRASLSVSLRLEELSAGRIDAASLNDDVRAARAGLARQAEAAEPFTEARVIVCERRVDGGVPNACTFVDCPHGARGAIGEAA